MLGVMANSQSVDRAVPDAGRAWFIGGALLLAMVVVVVAMQPVTSLIHSGGILGTALFAASLLVFAFGIGGSGSVTGRRPLGTAALTTLAGWALLGSVLATFGFSNDSPPGALLVFSYVDSFVQFAVALVAVIQIARAGVVPAPWNWAPAWALAAVSVPWLLMQIATAGASEVVATLLVIVVGTVDSIARIGGAMFLGVLSIVLADRSHRAQTVSVR